MVYKVDVMGCGEMTKPDYSFSPIPRVVFTCEEGDALENNGEDTPPAGE